MHCLTYEKCHLNRGGEMQLRRDCRKLFDFLRLGRLVNVMNSIAGRYSLDTASILARAGFGRLTYRLN
jgi:hypothetical protein